MQTILKYRRDVHACSYMVKLNLKKKTIPKIYITPMVWTLHLLTVYL